MIEGHTRRGTEIPRSPPIGRKRLASEDMLSEGPFPWGCGRTNTAR